MLRTTALTLGLSLTLPCTGAWAQYGTAPSDTRANSPAAQSTNGTNGTGTRGNGTVAPSTSPSNGGSTSGLNGTTVRPGDPAGTNGTTAQPGTGSGAPGTNGQSYQQPGRNGTTGQPTQQPGTSGTTGQPYQQPGIGGTTGQTHQQPGRNGTTGQPYQQPGSNGITGQTNQQPGTSRTNGFQDSATQNGRGASGVDAQRDTATGMPSPMVQPGQPVLDGELIALGPIHTPLQEFVSLNVAEVGELAQQIDFFKAADRPAEVQMMYHMVRDHVLVSDAAKNVLARRGDVSRPVTLVPREPVPMSPDELIRHNVMMHEKMLARVEELMNNTTSEEERNIYQTAANATRRHLEWARSAERGQPVRLGFFGPTTPLSLIAGYREEIGGRNGMRGTRNGMNRSSRSARNGRRAR